MMLVAPDREPVEVQGAHWAWRYIGKPWTETKNCWYWFRRIQSEVFGIEVPAYGEVSGNDVATQVRLFRDSEERGNWRTVQAVMDGDAALMSLRTRSHHIGIVAVVRSIPMIVHAVENMGVVATRIDQLPLLGWEINGVYRHVSRHSSA